MHCETGGLWGSLIPLLLLRAKRSWRQEGGESCSPLGVEGLGKDQTLPGTAWLTVSQRVCKSKSSQRPGDVSALFVPVPPRIDSIPYPRCHDQSIEPGLGFPGGTSGKESSHQCSRYERPRFDPWVGEISPGEGNGKPTPVSLPGKVPDRGAWRAAVHGAEKRRTRLSTRQQQGRGSALSWGFSASPAWCWD